MLANQNADLKCYLQRFENDNLKQSALLIIGSSDKLTSDTFIVMAYGFHPNLPQYGKVKSGESLWPNDYYRAWKNVYAKAGFNVLVPDYSGHNDSEGSTYTHQAGKVEFSERFYASELITAANPLEKHLSAESRNIVLIGHSMASPITFYAASQLRDDSQIKNKVKSTSLWSSAIYRFPKINVSAKYVLHHGKYDAVTPVSNIEFYLQNYKNSLLATFIYESEQHLLSADDFDHAVSTNTQLIREIENGNH